jgi:hypothetical protein
VQPRLQNERGAVRSVDLAGPRAEALDQSGRCEGSHPVSKNTIVDHDKRRRRALMVFQILIYGYLATMFLIQLWMYSVRDW